MSGTLVELSPGYCIKGWYWGRSAEGRHQVMCPRDRPPEPGDPPGTMMTVELPKGALDGLGAKKGKTWVTATVERVDAAGAHWTVRTFNGIRALTMAEFFVGHY